jgi:RNase H-fold protein (predicted Holliday junction resolvase)
VRIVGLDVGERRIGVAVTDVTRTLARPHGVLRPGGLDVDAVEVAADEIARLRVKKTASFPSSSASRDASMALSTDMTRRVERFARQLATRTRSRRAAGRAALEPGS